MSNVYSLDALRADMDKEFAPLQITIGSENVTLQNLMRIPKNDRNKVLEALKVVEASNAEVTEEGVSEETSVEEVSALNDAVETILSGVCAGNKGKKLIDALNGDLMLGMKILEMWTEATQPGEAENSSA